MPDSNHKPEIAIALSDFQAFASFRSFDKIASSVNSISELQEALGEKAKLFSSSSSGSEEDLRNAIRTILDRNLNESPAMSRLVASLVKKCKEQGDKALGQHDAGLAETFIMLNDDYEGDAAAFVCAFFMNLYKLKVGECK